MTPFEIEAKHIRRLDQGELTRLLKRLLHAEADQFGLARSTSEVPVDINVADGGDDGFMRWQGGPDRLDFVCNRFSMFQCKSGESPMGPSEFANEITVKGGKKLKDRVAEVLDAGGSYVFFVGVPCKAMLQRRRIEACRKRLKSLKRKDAKSADIQIYDADKIADWVNRYIAARIYVLECNGIQPPWSLKTWEEWAKNEAHGLAYVENERLKGYIDCIRESCLREPPGVVRITGLSGLGKTRLALEAFRTETESAAIRGGILRARVAYLDAGLGDGDIVRFLSQMGKMGAGGIVVVDDCEPLLHRKLQQELGYQSNRKISLITLDFEPEERNASYQCIQLKQSDCQGVVRGIIKEQFPKLGDATVSRIEEFAQGFAGIAVLMVKDVQEGVPEIGRISDAEIVKRLLWGREGRDDQAIAVITACSLFERIEFSDDECTGEIGFLGREIAKIHEDKFSEVCQRYLRRGILQRRGRFISVSPIPLAITLAAEWWERKPTKEILKLIGNLGGEGLLERFAEQAKKLHFVKNARIVVEKLCGGEGPFGDPGVLLTEEGSRLFRALVEVNPQATTEVVWRILDKRSREELLEIKGHVRRNLVWALENLCWWNDTFGRGARLMLGFAAAENETWGNNATSLFLQLFHVYLAGTEANLKDRLELIREALKSEVKQERELAIRALGSALETDFFSRRGGVESQGCRVPGRDYEPGGQELCDYRKVCIELLKEEIISGGEFCEIAAQRLAVEIGGLVRNGMIDEVEGVIRSVASRRGAYWPEGLEAIRHLLDRDSEEMPSQIRSRVEALERLLLPEGLEDKLRLIVSIPDWRARKNEQGDYISLAAEEAVKLAEEVAGEGGWYSMLPAILAGEQRQAYAFGRRLGELVRGRLRKAFIGVCVDFLGKTSPEVGNPDVLGAFLGAVSDVQFVKDTMDAIVRNPKLMGYAVRTTRCLEIGQEDLERLVPLIEEKQVPIADWRILSYGRALDGVGEGFVTEFCLRIANRGSQGSNCALDILWMYCRGNEERFAVCAKGFREIVMKSGLLIREKEWQMAGHNWEVVVCGLLRQKERDVELARHVTQEIVGMCGSDHVSYTVITTNAKAVLRVVLDRYFKECWPIVRLGGGA
ncbi:MAG: hypothetical protein ACYST6_05270 [Planctomycetota bacterium]|jgi:hypothetical protein